MTNMGNSGFTGKNKAAIYARISRDAEGEKIGVKRQIDLCKQLAESRSLTVDEAHIYSDNDVGASERTGAKKRENYNQMLEAARAGEFSIILSYSITRLTRRVKEFETLITLHDEAGVTFAMVDQNSDLDLTTPQGLFMARMLANVATFESDVISQRQEASFRHRALAGKPKLQRQRPFGWKADGVTIEPEEAQLIREAVKKIRAGASVTAIRREWEEAGVLTAAGKKVWEHGSLKRVLVGWRTAGVRTYRREPLYNSDGGLVMGTWEPIISLEDREAALAMLAKRTRKKIRQGTWLLTGLVRCGLCGGKMYGQLTGTHTYACKPGSGHLVITASFLEDYVLKALAGRLLQKENQGEASNEPEMPQAWPKESRLAQVVEMNAELWADWRAGKVGKEIVYAQSNELDAERKELLREREEFYTSTVEAVIPYGRTSELLEWAQDLAGQDLHEREPKAGERPEWENPPWGAASESEEDKAVDDLFGEVDPDIEDKKLLLHNELEAVLVKPGQRGRAGWGREAFLKRVEIHWRD